MVRVARMMVSELGRAGKFLGMMVTPFKDTLIGIGAGPGLSGVGKEEYRPADVSHARSNRERGNSVGVTTMRARQRRDGAALGPEALKAIGEAFDAAWAEIAPTFGNDPVAIEGARMNLANVLLSIATEDSRDGDALKNAALQRMGSPKSD